MGSVGRTGTPTPTLGGELGTQKPAHNGFFCTSFLRKGVSLGCVGRNQNLKGLKEPAPGPDRSERQRTTQKAKVDLTSRISGGVRDHSWYNPKKKTLHSEFRVPYSLLKGWCVMPIMILPSLWEMQVEICFCLGNLGGELAMCMGFQILVMT